MRTPQRPLAFWTLAGLALLIGHNAVYLVQLGPGQALAAALRGAGHGYWEPASAVLGILGLGAGALAMARLWGLRRRARGLGAPPAPGPRGFGRRWLVAWATLLAVVAVGFLVQENVEHFISHNHAPGLGALLGPEYPLALPVLTVITAVGGLALALLRHVEHGLLAAIAVALRLPATRAPRTVLRPPLRLAFPTTSPMAGSPAGRAPPRTLVSAS